MRSLKHYDQIPFNMIQLLLIEILINRIINSNLKSMGIFRNAIWFIKGMLEFTKSGYQKASKQFVAEDLAVDLKNTVIMVTGANSGIGKEAALEVAKRGATVYLVCRNRERGEAALAEIKEMSKNQQVYLLLLDMSQPRQIYKFAQEFLTNYKKLDILVNNAGCMVNKRQVVQGNIQVNFATNTLGTHILTKSLLPLISKSQKPRVFIVSSGGMLTQKLKVDDLMNQQMKQDFDGTEIYAQNKRQQVVMAESYAKNYPYVYFASMHPGWADTPGVQTSMPSFREKMQDKLRTQQQGADTLVWMCCYKDLEQQENGAFFQDRQAVSKHLTLACTGYNVQEQRQLIKQLDQFYERFSK